MRRSVLVAALFLSAHLTHGADRATTKLMRVHWRGVDAAGLVYEWSDLIFSGDVDGFVTLWRGPSGEMFIFRQSDVYSKRVTSYSISNVKTKEYIRGGYKLPYDGATPAQAKANLDKLPQQAYKGVAFTVATNHFRATLPIEHWHLAPGKTKRDELRRSIALPFIQTLRENLTTATSFGSPAGQVACVFLLDVVAEDAVCRRDQTLKREVLATDCAFDAQFGYPCPLQ